ncbi:hypothetical protein N7495_001689 [Penicillium taxi]|uniref:uncharacterized protein n=1 Tax=Penicillium taxi TaxID=168475 RepID=UPI002545B7F3|nr:uncharacterized protein N7495_001689 [Penicillium taxi]KAJ5909007.1 hypothetical protein N7495_001689 [Penicillium taxi]
MPHAESTMTEPIVNGEKVHSQFLNVCTTSSILESAHPNMTQHLTSYPVVSESIAVFKENPYGAKSIDLADQGFARFAKPVLPYFSTPYSYIAPYVSRADVLGDQGLSKIDSRFPIIREDTEKIRGTIYNNAVYPVRVAGDVKHHVIDTFGTEYKKCGGDGFVASGKAVITTSLVLSSESLAWATTFFQNAKEEVKEVVNEKINH